MYVCVCVCVYLSVCPQLISSFHETDKQTDKHMRSILTHITIFIVC